MKMQRVPARGHRSLMPLRACIGLVSADLSRRFPCELFTGNAFDNIGFERRGIGLQLRRGDRAGQLHRHGRDAVSEVIAGNWKRVDKSIVHGTSFTSPVKSPMIVSAFSVMPGERNTPFLTLITPSTSNSRRAVD